MPRLQKNHKFTYYCGGGLCGFNSPTISALFQHRQRFPKCARFGRPLEAWDHDTSTWLWLEVADTLRHLRREKQAAYLSEDVTTSEGDETREIVERLRKTELGVRPVDEIDELVDGVRKAVISERDVGERQTCAIPIPSKSIFEEEITKTNDHLNVHHNFGDCGSTPVVFRKPPPPERG